MYRATYDSHGARLSFTRGQNGLWTLRYSSRSETLGRVTPGPVTIDIRLGDLLISGTGDGTMQETRLVAD